MRQVAEPALDRFGDESPGLVERKRADSDPVAMPNSADQYSSLSLFSRREPVMMADKPG